jgi:outer membrane lipoprotein-sorting protein
VSGSAKAHRSRWAGLGAAGCLVAVVSVALAGCAVQSRTKLPTVPYAPALKTATLAQLLEQVRQQQDAIRTINGVVELQPTVSSVQKGEVVTYRDVRAFLLVRKPANLRMIGQFPVVRNTAFDLASDGEHFGLYVPTKNRYIEGNSREGKRSKSALENLRPQHILDVLLVSSPETGREQAALEVATEGQKSYYIVLILRPGADGALLLERKLWFEREQLTLARLQIFDAGGALESDVSYSNYGEFGDIRYPQQIVFNRPQDEYGLMLMFSEIKFNEPLADDKFQLSPPAGAEIVDLEKQPA